MNYRNMSRALAGVAAVGLSLLLGACGGGGGGGSGSSSGGGTAPVDTTPNAFTFTAQSGMMPAAVVTSDEITISGINSGAAISITGGEYSIDGGNFTGAAGTINNNQKVRVRGTAPSQFSTGGSIVLTVGGVTATFNATTVAADTTPAAFTFAYGTNAVRDAWINSGSITITGINTATPVSIANGEYSIAGGAFTSAAGTITSGQAIVVRVRAATDYSRITRAQLTVGGVTAAFEATSELPVYLPDSVAHDGQDTIYLLSNANRLVFRWSIPQQRYLDPLPLAAGAQVPAHMVYSPVHEKLFLAYDTGAIRQIALTGNNQAETAFASVGAAVSSLGAAGKFLVAQTSGYNGGYVLNASGAVVDQGGYYYGYSRETAWDATNSRLYYTRDGLSPNDLHYDVIDQATGDVSSTGETPYHGDYNILPPIRVSAGGQYVLLGSGDIYSQQNLDWSGSVAGQIADARWCANGSLVTLATSGNQTVLRRLSATNLSTLELRTFTGEALRVVGTDTAMAVLVNDAGNLRIFSYTPDDDSDDDGVTNTQDAFPLDIAASVDTDQDGYPDSWNTGRTQADSTTGLTVDAFPADSACWLPAHGSGGACNYGATIPNYTPDQVAQSGDVVYLLSSANRRVYRWSISGNAYLNPYVVGMSQGFSTAAPTVMAFVGAQQRLYLGYASGAIRYIAVGTGPAEVQFANAAAGIYGMASAGNYLAVQTLGGYGSGYLYSAAGVITDQGGYYYGYSRDAEWDAVNSRLYYTREGISPNDLHYDAIDQANGKVTATAETPYHGDYNIQTPIRVSNNGQFILLASGDLYRHTDLHWTGSLGAQFTDARWLANGSLVTVTATNNQTTLRRRSGANLGIVEQLAYTGDALRVVGSDTAMVVVLLNNGTVQFRAYAPDDDSDDDGVENTVDAFPLDRAASVDSDRDGYPDAWNAGRGAADSTTGLALDAFPSDAACWLSSHGSGGVCNYGATIPNYTPDRIEQNGDVIYLLSRANQRVYRWSISGNAYLNPYVVGINQGLNTIVPTTMTFSPAHNRLYVGYETGAIRYFDVAAAAPAETPFTNVAQSVNGLASVGNYVLAQDDSGAWETHYIINQAGVITDQAEWNYYSPEYTWDPVSSRVYFYRGNSSPSDVHYEVIDQAIGQITGAGETPYHGDYVFGGVIRPSNDGAFVLLGSGDIYSRTDLAWSGSVGGAIADARWLANGSLVTLAVSGNQTTLRRRGASNLGLLEQRTFTGQALRVLGTDAAMVLVLSNNGTVTFQAYVPNDDSDGDGVTNTADAFPLDRAASVDSDGDGHPNAWNAGRSQADSTTGLVLDAFPNDAACWLSSHGMGGVCNFGATIPNYVPDQVAQSGDVIYLLSAANRRVYRWSISGNAYLNPYVVGINQGFSTVAPTTMTFSEAHHRLYFGYPSGAIQYIDVNAATAVELPFTTAASAIASLGTAGNYVIAQSNGGNIYNTTGAVTGSGGYYYGYSRETAWDPVTSRLYYTRDGISPNDLHYDEISQSTGQVTGTNETPYHGSYSITPPIRVSADGQRILLGSGDIYRPADLNWIGSVGAQLVDARWMANGQLVMVTTNGTQTTLRRLASANLAVLEQLTYSGQALRVVGSDAAMVVVVSSGGTAQFRGYVPNDDSDGDGVTNTADAFPLDVAASVDSDGDGYPNAWNAGRSQADSTTGLTLDSFPNDAACWLPAHGSGGVCNYGATIPAYLPDQVAQNGDVIYLLSSANRRVYRWSISGSAYLNPYVVGVNQGLTTLAPTQMTFSAAHNRLYLGYENGNIRYINVGAATPAETAFTSVALPVHGLAAVGNFLLAQDDSGAWETHYIINQAGVITDQEEWNYYSPEYAWDPVNSRVYFFRANSSPGDLHYEVIDQTSGQITGLGETPYHGDHSFGGVIRVSTSGQYVMVGTGDVYQHPSLTWSGSLGGSVADGRWLANGTLVTLSTSSNQTVLRRRSAASLTTIEQLTFTGLPLRVVGSDAAMTLLVNVGGTVQFRSYVPNDDSDGDGVSNTADAFPLDAAASVDTDRDGYPDAWNAGRGQADSTTGLVLDAFPNDAACWLASHGSGGVCNNGATIPNYTPDQVVNNGDVVYLLSSANRRVYRWSMATAAYLNPYVVGINQGFSTISPTRMAYSVAQHRLYLGYENGAIQYIDVNAGSPVEVPFATAAAAIFGLNSAGNFLAVQSQGGYGSGAIYNSAGGITAQGGYYYGYSREATFDPVTSRLYYMRDGISPNDLHFDEINQTTGLIPATGETPYHGTYSIAPPIRVSTDGQYVLLGSGDLYDRNGLTWAASLGKSISDAHWTGNVLVDVDTTDKVEIRDATTRAVLQSYQYTGTPIRVLFGATEAYLVHLLNGTVSFIRLPFYDNDADTIPRWWEQRYGLSDSNVGDAALDPDTDGLNNVAEYANHTDPQVADTDGDGLGDFAEAITYLTNPTRADTDGDGLSDAAEINTHHSNPRDTDSDDDGYSDLVEVLYGGDPNDVSELPDPLTSYTQTFEGTPNLNGWAMPSGTVPWALDGALARSGSNSYKSGAIANSQFSATRFRGFFAAGQLSFWARWDAGSCCNRLIVSIDGAQVLNAYTGNTWSQYTFPLVLGVHDIEWRFERDYYGGTSNDSARIDDVVFTGQ
ncbi:MAG TPA: hypothetical protein VM146_00455 [Steroidobacteraceae bacterium]|nr:hypothetical protein [Steroidobacteraceae bacterium]